MEDLKGYILRAVRRATSDDLERANLAFRGMTSTELDKEWGYSGKTCKAIWNEYKEERELNKKAIELVKSKL